MSHSRFGDEGEYAYHLIFEFFGLGNVILTDHEFKIIALQRSVELDGVGENYLMTSNVEKFKISGDLLKKALYVEPIVLVDPTNEEIALLPLINPGAKGFKKTKKTATLKNILRTSLGKEYGPSLIDHAIALSGLLPSMIEFSSISADSKSFAALLHGFQSSDDILVKVRDGGNGYILADLIAGEPQYLEYHPFIPSYFREDAEHILITYPTFSIAVDEFYSKIETQKLALKFKQAEIHAAKKLQAVKDSSNNLIRNFQLSQEKKELMAIAIELNVDLVDNVIKTLQGLLAGSMDWGDLEEVVRMEKSLGNPVALVIRELKLADGIVILELPINMDEEKDASNVSVEIDIYISAYANATVHHGARKLAVEKEQKSIINSRRAVEFAEAKIMKTLEKTEDKVARVIRVRAQWWFEKFLWFISSENYLVVAGKDVQQSEMLGTKFRDNDTFFVTSDFEGSTPVFVRRLDESQKGVIPPTTLQQAATMSICQSRAWEQKIVTSAFYVMADEITKTSFAGDMLPAGSFAIKSGKKKNFLPPVQLIFGVALLFLVADKDKEGHRLERRPWARGVITEGEGTSMEKAKDSIEDKLLEETWSPIIADLRFAEDEVAPSLPESVEEVDSEIDDKLEEQSRIAEDLDQDASINDGEESVDVKPLVEVVPLKSARPLPRGQKSKMKKVNSKYADQDDEDRQAVIEMIGANRGAQPKGKKAKALLEKQKLQAERERIETEKRKVKLEQQVKSNSVPKPKPTILPSAEGVDIDAMKDINLDCLTSEPFENDEILACIPICAPWIAIQRKYKYKIKLTPGSLKRGKGAKSAQSLFVIAATKAKSPRELELIKEVADQDWIDSMMSKVKLVSEKK